MLSSDVWDKYALNDFAALSPANVLQVAAWEAQGGGAAFAWLICQKTERVFVESIRVPLCSKYSLCLIYEYTRKMGMFSASVFFGWFLGFAFGVGCALAVMYSIYRSGYRNAVLDALKGSHPDRYREAILWAKKRMEGKVSDSVL